jgi:hypothetical protein
MPGGTIVGMSNNNEEAYIRRIEVALVRAMRSVGFGAAQVDNSGSYFRGAALVTLVVAGLSCVGGVVMMLPIVLLLFALAFGIFEISVQKARRKWTWKETAVLAGSALIVTLGVCRP